MKADNLAQYVVELFKWFADDRRNLLEHQWLRNYDAFRGRYNSENLEKWRATEGSQWRSKVFVRLTKQKVVTGFNHVSALMLQGGKLPWSISPTPVPESSPGVFLDPMEARARADRMSRVISDNLAECQAEDAYLQAVLEGAVYGLSWLRGPMLRERDVLSTSFGVPGAGGIYLPDDVVRRHGRFSLGTQKVWRPEVDSPSVWNMFWDLEADNHQDGHGVIFMELMSQGRFAELIEQSGFSKAESVRVAKEYEGTAEKAPWAESLGPLLQQYGVKRRVIPVFTFWGRVPEKHLAPYGLDQSGVPGKEREIYCVVAGGATPAVIRKPVLNPLPYRQIFMSKWQDIPHEPGGVGTPEDIEDTQMIVNGLTRAMLDNKNLSSNLLMWWNPRRMAAGQSKGLYPGKAFETDEGTEQLEQAMRFFAPPDVTGNTPQLIEMFKAQADDESGFGRIMDGSAGGVKKTAFEISQVSESGNKMIGGICRNHDRGFIEPMIRAFYHYHMMVGTDESVKGDFTCVARGFQSFKDKSVRGMKLMELAQFALSNALTQRYARARWFLSELAKINDFNPDEAFKTDDEVEQEAAKLAAMLPGNQPVTPEGMAA